jgi:predicted dinucleotide-binding enzyme
MRTKGRIAVAVAGLRDRDREIAIALVEDTGFDGLDGALGDSWRQQPGSPVYCTDLTYEEMGAALAAAERERHPERRDVARRVFAGTHD